MALAYGLDIADLPDGWTPLEAVIVLRCIDEQGNETAAMRTTGMQDWEVVGLLEMAKHETMTAASWEDE